MEYRVRLSPEADDEIEEALRWIFERSARGAVRWYNGLMEALQSLSHWPNRCPLAPENETFDEEIRQLLYGRRMNRYRILFTVEGREVRILHVRHGARRYLRPNSGGGDDN